MLAKAKPLSYLAYSTNFSVSNFAPASVCAHIATLKTFSPFILRMPGGIGNRVWKTKSVHVSHACRTAITYLWSNVRNIFAVLIPVDEEKHTGNGTFRRPDFDADRDIEIGVDRKRECRREPADGGALDAVGKMPPKTLTVETAFIHGAANLKVVQSQCMFYMRFVQENH
jgi:hypothetical protein